MLATAIAISGSIPALFSVVHDREERLTRLHVKLKARNGTTRRRGGS